MRTSTAGTTVPPNQPRLVRSLILVYTVVFAYNDFISTVDEDCFPAFAGFCGVYCFTLYFFAIIDTMESRRPGRPGSNPRGNPPTGRSEKKRKKTIIAPGTFLPPLALKLLEAKFLRSTGKGAFPPIWFLFSFFFCRYFSPRSFILPFVDTFRYLSWLGLPRRWRIEMGGGGLLAYSAMLSLIFSFLRLERNNDIFLSFR